MPSHFMYNYLWKGVFARGWRWWVGARVAGVDDVREVLLEVAAGAVVHQDGAAGTEPLSATSWEVKTSVDKIVIAMVTSEK